MLFPINFDDFEAEYWHLLRHVTLWDVAVERQLEVQGKDGFRFAQLVTPREQEILVFVASGLSNRQISERLFITEKTASHHVSNILAKLGVSGRAEAAAEAVSLGLTSPPG